MILKGLFAAALFGGLAYDQFKDYKDESAVTAEAEERGWNCREERKELTGDLVDINFLGTMGLLSLLVAGASIAEKEERNQNVA